MLVDEARSGFCIEDHQIRILAALYPDNVTHIRIPRLRKITRDTLDPVYMSHFYMLNRKFRFPVRKIELCVIVGLINDS